MSDTPMMSEPAFNCKFPCSPCSYAHECRQIRHCSYIYKQETDELIAAEYTNQELTKKLEYAQKLMTAFGENQEKLVIKLKQMSDLSERIGSLWHDIYTAPPSTDYHAGWNDCLTKVLEIVAEKKIKEATK